jgi:hypothetical protein
MRFFPSERMPTLPFDRIDWRLKAAVGREGLSQIWQDLWWSGVAAGRIEGIVGTLLVVLMLAVLTLIVVVALRGLK